MSSAKKNTIINIEFLDIQGDGFHLMIEVYVNDKKAIMLIDTGASKTVFDKNRISNFLDHSDFELNEQLSTGLGTNSMQSHSTLVHTLRLGELIITDYKVVLLDLSHVNISYNSLKLPSIDGVLGSDILLKYKAVVDYSKKQLKLRLK